MCGIVNINGRNFTPGFRFKYVGIKNILEGRWGLGDPSDLTYNARIENSNTTWKSISSNRGIMQVNGFFEKSSLLRLPNKGLINLATLNTPMQDFVVITRPSQASLMSIHHRMPLIIEDINAWLDEGIVNPDAEFIFDVI